MPTIPHVETHSTSSDTVSDIVICMADRLTVPAGRFTGPIEIRSAVQMLLVGGLAAGVDSGSAHAFV